MSLFSCDRCSSCPRTHRQVLPDGRDDASVMVIGEGPGRWEDSTGTPFVGVSGQELDSTYLRLAGLDRSDVFVTNCVQCRCERNGVDVKPGDTLVQVCAANHLAPEIYEVQPRIIILCGATACSLVPGIDLELEHGFPRTASIFGYEAIVVPMYHPAAGMHETKFMTPLLEDWEKLGLYMRGKWTPPSEKPAYKYRLIKRGDLIEWDSTPEYLPIDTESDEGKPYSIQFSLAPGTGYMILTSDTYSMNWFKDFFNRLGGRAVMHFAIHDLDELDDMGIHVRECRDTMMELYHLGNLPQGLKAAVYRTFGYRMTSYDEVVTPYSKSVLEGWLAEALAHASMHMRTLHREQLKTKVRETWKPHESEAVLRRIMGKLTDGSDYDAWQMPKVEQGVEKPRLIGRDWLHEIEAGVGRMPRKSIIHAPMDQQITYACSDADWTGRLARWLEAERRRIVREEWKVAA